MKLLGFILFFSYSALASDCYYFGHPSTVQNGKCQKPAERTDCGQSLFRCDSTLFGENLCVENNQQILKTCYKESYKNKKRFDNKPAYLYYSYQNHLDEIIKYCLSNDKTVKSSRCHELLLIARESKNFFENHTKVIEDGINPFPAFCDPFLDNYFPWINHLLPTTQFYNKNPFPEPKITVTDLKTNPRGTYCIRDDKVIDTVVLHHTETRANLPIKDINDFHISKGWYQTGYHYIIDSEDETEADKIYQTRNPLINGAHTGRYAYSKNKQIGFKKEDLGCFRASGNTYKKPDRLINSRGYIKANATTLGIALLGNYAAFDPRMNPTGYFPSEQKKLSAITIDKLSKLLCHLQGRYPTIKYLKKHNDYKDTLCPGDIQGDFDKIILKTKELGCDYSL